MGRGDGSAALIDLPGRRDDPSALLPLHLLHEAEPGRSVEALQAAGIALQERLNEEMADSEQHSADYVNQVADDLYHRVFKLEEHLNKLLDLPCYQGLLAAAAVSADDVRGSFWADPARPFEVICRLNSNGQSREDLHSIFESLRQQAGRDRDEEDLCGRLAHNLDGFNHMLASEEADERERRADERLEAVKALYTESHHGAEADESVIAALDNLYRLLPASNEASIRREQLLLGQLFN